MARKSGKPKKTAKAAATENREKLECDLVMRGGITSGIVYPGAVAKLAETYRFRSIGGTSAGAIAAAVTAAASLGAREGDDQFDTLVRNLPSELAAHHQGATLLQRLFQPQAETRSLFNVLLAGLQRKGSTLKKLSWFVLILWRNYPVMALLGGTSVLVPLLWLGFFAGLPVLWLALYTLLVLILAALAATVFVAKPLFRDIFTRLPENNYGLCSGHGDKDGAGVLPLTDWLHGLIQELANRSIDERPVTFGDLWGAEGRSGGERDIQLVLMTTNVTRGISHRFPFVEGSWGELYFREKDFQSLFPDAVVSWLRDHAQKTARKNIQIKKGYYRLPEPADIPILLGTRMSLSFPFLLSAVPLYAPKPKPGSKVWKLERCWFSDGGLTSNFPIHFFDSVLPSRPTFGINLVSHTVAVTETQDEEDEVVALSPKDRPGPAADDSWNYVSMPTRNSDGIGSMARFDTFDKEKGNLFGFLMTLFDTARNWSDTELMAMPGYRDRIVHLALKEGEGGLNLNMPDELIKSVAARGECAGELLAARFSPKPGNDPKTGQPIQLTWDNHRWVRYRAMMAGLENVARSFKAEWEQIPQPPGQWRTYTDLIQRGRRSKPTSYPWGNANQKAFAIDATEDFVGFVASWNEDHQTFDRGKASKNGRSPRPKPVLRTMPPGDSDPLSERFWHQRSDLPSS